MCDNVASNAALHSKNEEECWCASNNHSQDQVKISTDNRSIFDRVCDVGD